MATIIVLARAALGLLMTPLLSQIAVEGRRPIFPPGAGCGAEGYARLAQRCWDAKANKRCGRHGKSVEDVRARGYVSTRLRWPRIRVNADIFVHSRLQPRCRPDFSDIVAALRELREAEGDAHSGHIEVSEDGVSLPV